MALKVRKNGAWVNCSTKTIGSIIATANGSISAGDPVIVNSDGTVSKFSVSNQTMEVTLKEGPPSPYWGSNSEYYTYNWTVPSGITAISVVCVGGGGGGGSKRSRWGGGGAGLGHANISVTAGNLIEIQVGAGGKGGIYDTTVPSGIKRDGYDGGDTWLKYDGSTKCSGEGGEGVSNHTSTTDAAEGEGGGYTGDGGGNGGQGGFMNESQSAYNRFGAGGGGAGGYDGKGGDGGNCIYNVGTGENGEDGAGGGAGGGGSDGEQYPDNGGGGAGGGVGIFGEGLSGEGGAKGGGGAGKGGFGGEKGSGGQDGERGGSAGGTSDNTGGDGGQYGGGGGQATGSYTSSPRDVYGGDGGRGAIRITTNVDVSTLNTDNFIGFSTGDYGDGDSARINTVNSIDTNQSGLTVGQTYYVQLDGTLATTPDTQPFYPTIKAGIALNSTDLLITLADHQEINHLF